MTSTPCPFCNAPLPPLAASPTADKLPCPRCGEPVPAARWTVDAAAHGVREGEPKAEPFAATTTKAKAGPHNRKTALTMLGIMGVMALISLVFILWTRDFRRALDPHITKKLEPIGQRRPLELAGLGYLPKNVPFVAGFHVAEMMADKDVGKKLLDEPRPAVVDWVFKQISRMAGLGPADLDHVIVGVTLDNTPQLVMVMKTLAAYDPAQIAKAARPAKTPLYKEKPLYAITLNPIGEGLLWCVEERVLVCVFRQDVPTTAHLDAISPDSRLAKEVLPAPLFDVLKERLRTPQYAWVVGRADQLGLLKAFLPKNLAALKEMKTFALGIEPTEGLTLTGNFQMNDAKSAASFKTFLDVTPIEAARSQKSVATEEWVAWQVRGDPATFRKMLDRNQKPE